MSGNSTVNRSFLRQSLSPTSVVVLLLSPPFPSHIHPSSGFSLPVTWGYFITPYNKKGLSFHHQPKYRKFTIRHLSHRLELKVLNTKSNSVKILKVNNRHFGKGNQNLKNNQYSGEFLDFILFLSPDGDSRVGQVAELWTKATKTKKNPSF